MQRLNQLLACLLSSLFIAFAEAQEDPDEQTNPEQQEQEKPQDKGKLRRKREPESQSVPALEQIPDKFLPSRKVRQVRQKVSGRYSTEKSGSDGVDSLADSLGRLVLDRVGRLGALLCCLNINSHEDKASSSTDYTGQVCLESPPSNQELLPCSGSQCIEKTYHHCKLLLASGCFHLAKDYLQQQLARYPGHTEIPWHSGLLYRLQRELLNQMELEDEVEASLDMEAQHLPANFISRHDPEAFDRVANRIIDEARRMQVAGKWEEALSYLRNKIDVNASLYLKRHAALLRACHHYFYGNTDAAEDEYLNALTWSELDPEAYIELIVFYHKQGLTKIAEALAIVMLEVIAGSDTWASTSTQEQPKGFREFLKDQLPAGLLTGSDSPGLPESMRQLIRYWKEKGKMEQIRYWLPILIRYENKSKLPAFNALPLDIYFETGNTALAAKKLAYFLRSATSSHEDIDIKNTMDRLGSLLGRQQAEELLISMFSNFDCWSMSIPTMLESIQKFFGPQDALRMLEKALRSEGYQLDDKEEEKLVSFLFDPVHHRQRFNDKAMQVLTSRHQRLRKIWQESRRKEVGQVAKHIKDFLEQQDMGLPPPPPADGYELWHSLAACIGGKYDGLRDRVFREQHFRSPLPRQLQSPADIARYYGDSNLLLPIAKTFRNSVLVLVNEGTDAGYTTRGILYLYNPYKDEDDAGNLGASDQRKVSIWPSAQDETSDQRESGNKRASARRRDQNEDGAVVVSVRFLSQEEVIEALKEARHSFQPIVLYNNQVVTASGINLPGLLGSWQPVKRRSSLDFPCNYYNRDVRDHYRTDHADYIDSFFHIDILTEYKKHRLNRQWFSGQNGDASIF